MKSIPVLLFFLIISSLCLAQTPPVTTAPSCLRCSSPSVIDATGKILGKVIGTDCQGPSQVHDNDFDSALILLRHGSQLYNLCVGVAEFYGQTSMMFESVDCTGEAYEPNFPSWPGPLTTLIPQARVGKANGNDTLYVPDYASGLLTINAQSTSNQEGFCSALSQQTTVYHLIPLVNLTTAFVAPFRIQ